MPNVALVARSPGTRQPTIPDEPWERALPILRAKIGNGGFIAKEIAAKVGVSPAAVSQWLSDKSRPNQTNLIRCLQAIGEDPAEVIPELVPLQRAEGRSPIDDALLQLVYDNPLKATAYVMAAQEQKALTVAESTSSYEVIRRIRIAVGEDVERRR